jgi:hypothetical protein
MDEKDIIVSPDEAKAEQEALAEAKADEIRSRVASELGLSEDDAVVEKVVQRELDHKKKLSEAIGQKIKYRDAAKGSKPATPAPAQPAAPALDPEEIRKQTEMTVTERLEQRDLDEMEYPDDVKAQIKEYARFKGISVRKAEKEPVIQVLIDQAKAAGRITEAGVTRTPRPTPTQSANMPNFDMSTEEGRKQYDDWMKNKG